MKKLFLLLLFTSVLFASQAPLLIFSSQNLDSFKSQVFLGLEDLVGKVYEKEVSKKTILYKIQTPYAPEDTLNYLIRNKEKLPILTRIFNDKKRSYSSKFISYSVSSLQEQLLTKMKPESLELKKIDFSSILTIDQIISSDLSLLSRDFSYTLIVAFDQSLPQMRLLQETDPTPVPPSPTPVDPTLNIPLKPYVMTGYLFSLFALFVTLVGSIALCSVQTPEKLPRLPLLIGRES